MDTIFGSLYTTGAYDLRDHMLVHSLWDSGIRESELAALIPDDVDLHTCQIRIQYAKFGKWSDTDFSKETRQYLMSYLRQCRPPNLRLCLSALTDRRWFANVPARPQVCFVAGCWSGAEEETSDGYRTGARGSRHHTESRKQCPLLPAPCASPSAIAAHP